MVRSILLRGFDQQCAELIGNYMGKHNVKFVKGAVPTKVVFSSSQLSHSQTCPMFSMSEIVNGCEAVITFQLNNISFSAFFSCRIFSNFPKFKGFDIPSMLKKHKKVTFTTI